MKYTGSITLTSHGVGSRRQHKYQRDGAVGVQVTLTQVKGRRLHKLLPQFVGHIVSDGWCDLIRPEAAINDHLLQIVELVAPRCGQTGVVGLQAVVDCSEALCCLNEGLSEGKVSHTDFC